MTSDGTTIAILGDRIPARHERMPIHELHFLPENPRVYGAIREVTDFCDLTPEEKQVRIYRRLLQEPSVKNLIPEIKRDGGLQDPIIVRMDRRQVIEGNSRLAVFRKLWDETRGDQWAYIRCLVVTELTDDQQNRLLAQTHLKGKTEWSPHAQAHFCFRWVVEHRKKIAMLAELSGLSVYKIKNNVAAIQLMKDNDDNTLSHFSYYYVLASNKTISSTIERRPNLRDTLFTQIKDEAFTAQQMRQQVPTIVEKPRFLRKYEKGDIDLHQAYDRAKISGTQRRLKRIRGILDDIERKQIDRLEYNEINAVRQVLRRIRRELGRVSGMVDDRSAVLRGRRPSSR